jgi:hypothetical protein
MKLSRYMAATAVLASAVAGTAVLAPQASAATRAAYNGVCGSGYKVVNSAPIGQKGTVYLTYNSANGKNCVATIRANPGKAKYMSTYIYVPDTDEWAGDSGNFTSYAGPGYVYGKSHCVSWGGNIDNVYVSVENSNCASLKEHRVTEVR